MLNFITKVFEKEIKECLSYIDEKQRGFSGLNLDFYDINSEDFDPSEYDDTTIDENYLVTISPDYSEESLEVTLRGLIDLVNELKSAKLIDQKKCITERRCLIRVSTNHYEDNAIIDFLFNGNKNIFVINSQLNNINFSCSLIKGVTGFGLMIHFSDDFDKYYPSVVNEDMFIEIIYDKPICEKDIDKIANSYIFELRATHNIKIAITARPTDIFDEIDEGKIAEKSYILRPLLFGKGIDELLELFNESEDGFNSYDYSIIQYTKVLEYVSQTVIRQEITNKAYSKLMCPKALSPDANYIKELEIMFADFKQKYDTDRNAIKITVKTCCDILEVVDFAPKYLKRLVELKNNLSKEKADKESILESAYEQLADSISDTRNYIAHAKANYTLKGNECPKSQRGDLVSVLKILSVQTIRWFSTVFEDNRFVPK